MKKAKKESVVVTEADKGKRDVSKTGKTPKKKKKAKKESVAVTKAKTQEKKKAKEQT